MCKDEKSLELTSTFSEADDSFIKTIDKLLIGSTFLIAPHISAIDVLLYPRACMTLKKDNIYVNVFRWCSQLQSLPDLKDIINEYGIAVTEMPKIQSADLSKGKKKKEAKKKETVPDFSRLDLRVGKIIKVEAQADSEKLFNEEIDIGNGEIRQISSGLRPYIPIEAIKDRNVIVFCNLKARKLAGKDSYGMVLCASNDDHSKIEVLIPPEGSKAGDQVIVDNIPKGMTEDINISKKKNPWEGVQPNLTTNEGFEVMYEGKPLKTDKGVIKTASLVKAHIS